MDAGKAGPICMDLRDVPEERWGIHPLILLQRFKAVCQRRPIRITPAGHFCIGGVRTDEQGQTSLPGLFACGEMVWGLHGANRMGGNALTECLVSGSLAGRNAAAVAREGPSAGDAADCAPAPAPAGGRAAVDLAMLRQRIQEAAWRTAGVIRSGEGMGRGLAEAEALATTVADGRADSPRERILRHDLLSAAFSFRAILRAGLERLESRGCFIRSDFPTQDDAHWRKNSRLSWDPSTNRLSVAHVDAETMEHLQGSDVRGQHRKAI
jgi:succinate dehydrogenase/fumarate reductase flavoprotein subunit